MTGRRCVRDELSGDKVSDYRWKYITYYYGEYLTLKLYNAKCIKMFYLPLELIQSNLRAPNFSLSSVTLKRT